MNVLRRVLEAFRKPEAESALLAALRRDGIVVLPAHFSAAQAAAFRDEIDRCYERKPELLWNDAQGSDQRLFGIERFSDAIRQAFYEDAFITETGYRYMHSRRETGFVLAGRIKYVEGNVGSGGGWHRDSATRPQFKALLYLSDVDASNGPFEYLVGSHLKPAIRAAAQEVDPVFAQARIPDAAVAALEAQSPPGLRRTVTGPEGSLVLVDTRGVHRGAPLAAGRRYALTRYGWYGGASIPAHIRARMNGQDRSTAMV